MNRADAIELAHQLTERKAEKILNMNLLFSSVCMDICKRARFWWRKLDVTFTFTAGTKTYDFSTLATTPAITGIAVEEIVVISLILPFGNSNVATQITPSLSTLELFPIFDARGFAAMKQNTIQGQPSRYCMGIDDWKTLRIDPPDQTYNVEMTFMGMPMPASTSDTIDASSNEIPLIPPFYHDAVVNGLCARINRRVWGANDSRYLDDKASYEECILRMMMREQFTSNVQKQWTSQDNSLSNGAIQSTAPNSP